MCVYTSCLIFLQSKHETESKRVIEEIENTKADKRKAQSAAAHEQQRKKKCRQENVDKMIIDFVGEALLPFSVVETGSFKSLIEAGFPGKTVLNRKDVAKGLCNEFLSIKNDLIKTFDETAYICITADCWSIFHR